jgi:hypothetical protein
MDDQELVKRLEELENKQWANKVLTEIRSQMKEYEYQIVFKTDEESYFGAIREFASSGYVILPGTTLFQTNVFIVLMRRDKVK